LLLPLFVW